MKQKDIIDILKKNDLVVKIEQNSENVQDVSDITYNSKACIENSAFFVKGANFKEEYLQDAIKRGARLIISEKEFDTSPANIVVVNNVRHAMVLVASDFFGRAYTAMNVIGLTGTKGKTTTTYFIKNILDE